VLQGRIARGVADRIKTVLWFSDLRDYTRISDSAPPESIIPLLNDYADAIVSAIHRHSGDVLKLIGDGVLAIFPAEDRASACAAALDAAKEARASLEILNERRRAEGLPATDMYLGLHLGVATSAARSAWTSLSSDRQSMKSRASPPCAGRSTSRF